MRGYAWKILVLKRKKKMNTNPNLETLHASLVPRNVNECVLPFRAL